MREASSAAPVLDPLSLPHFACSARVCEGLKDFGSAGCQTCLAYLKGYIHKGITKYSAIWIGGAPNDPVRTELRLAEFGTAVAEQRQHNHLLRSINGCQLDGDAAYAGIFEA